jgi:hypothetical protein
MTARVRLLRGTRTPVGVLMDTYVALPKSFVNRRASCWCAGGAPRAEGAPVMRKVAERRFSAGEKRRDDRHMHKFAAFARKLAIRRTEITLAGIVLPPVRRGRSGRRDPVRTVTVGPPIGRHRPGAGRGTRDHIQTRRRGAVRRDHGARRRRGERGVGYLVELFDAEALGPPSGGNQDYWVIDVFSPDSSFDPATCDVRREEEPPPPENPPPPVDNPQPQPQPQPQRAPAPAPQPVLQLVPPASPAPNPRRQVKTVTVRPGTARPRLAGGASGGRSPSRTRAKTMRPTLLRCQRRPAPSFTG